MRREIQNSKQQKKATAPNASKPKQTTMMGGRGGMETGVSEKVLANARKSGQLNISARGLSSIPKAVFHIHDTTPQQTSLSFDTDDK